MAAATMAAAATMTLRAKGDRNVGRRGPFCKVCKDAGKSQQEYTSHYPRENAGRESRVVCPTLLAQECGYCHAKGHTPKYCPALVLRDERRRQQQRHFPRWVLDDSAVVEADHVEMETVRRHGRQSGLKEEARRLQMTNSQFGALMSDSEDESESEEFPALSSARVPQSDTLRNYAKALTSKPLVEPVTPKGRVVPRHAARAAEFMDIEATDMSWGKSHASGTVATAVLSQPAKTEAPIDVSNIMRGTAWADEEDEVTTQAPSDKPFWARTQEEKVSVALAKPPHERSAEEYEVLAACDPELLDDGSAW